MLKAPYCQVKSKDLPSCRQSAFLRQSVESRNENPRRHAAGKPFHALLPGWRGPRPRLAQIQGKGDSLAFRRHSALS